MVQLLTQMAQHASEDASLLASHINRYGEREGVAWEEIARRLQIDTSQLAKLALCRHPRQSRFSEDVARIADYVGMNRSVLSLFVRNGDAVSPAPSPAARAKVVKDSAAVLTKRRVWALGVAVLALLVVGAVAFIQPKHNEATLVVSRGQATIVGSSRVVLAAKRTDNVISAGDTITVRDNDSITVGAGSSAQLHLFDGSTVELFENTTVQVVELNTTEDTYQVQLNMLSGKTVSRVLRLLGAGDMFKISTPSSTASVRGTIFTVEVIAANTTFVACDEGSVQVEVAGRQATVPAGAQLLAVVGQPLEVEPQADSAGSPLEVLPSAATNDAMDGQNKEAPSLPATDDSDVGAADASSKPQEAVSEEAPVESANEPTNDVPSRPTVDSPSVPTAAAATSANANVVLTARDDYATTPEDTPVSILVIDNDTDNLDPTTLSTISRPSNGTLAIRSDGTLTYRPAANFHGSDSFVYQVCDQAGDCDTATVNITVIPVNDPPSTADDRVNTLEDTLLRLQVADLLDNDTDVDGDVLEVNLLSDPDNGTLTRPSRGTLSYQPGANFHGSDSFTYEACDRRDLCDIASLTINVISVNDPPVAQDDRVTTPKGTPVTIRVLNNDSDVEGDPLAINSTTVPNHGTVTVRLNTQLTYIPDPSFSGNDTFTYVVCDPSNDCDTATVIVAVNPVNHRPAARDDSASTPEDTPLSVAAPGVLGNDIDIDDDMLAANLLIAPSRGTLLQKSSGSFSYTPDGDFHGNDSFTYEACDRGGLCAPATVTIRVISVNDPAAAADDRAVTAEDNSVRINVAVNDTDVDGNLDPAGAMVLASPASGTISSYNDGSFNYLPYADFFGRDGFTYQICDTDGLCDTAKVSIEVTPVDDRPVAHNDTALTVEESPVVIDVQRNDSAGPANEDQELTTTNVSDPANGTVTINTDGKVTYKPDLDFFGDDSFTYTVCDRGQLCHTATVIVVVDPVNDPPLARADSVSTAEDNPVSIDVVANDRDVDNVLLLTDVIVLTGPNDGSLSKLGDGSFNYQPHADFFGRDHFTYQICDRDHLCDTTDASIEVAPVNDPPVAHDDTASTDTDVAVIIDVQKNDSAGPANEDPRLTTTEVSTPANGTVTINTTGRVTYAPNPNFFGDDSFSYTVCDRDGLCRGATVTVVVGASNHPPLALADSASTAEDNPVRIDVANNDADVDGNLDPAGITVMTGPANGTTSNRRDGTISYLPFTDFFGHDSFTYQICDTDGLCDTATVSVEVTSVNDRPVAQNDTANTVEESPVDIDVQKNDSAGPANEDPQLTTTVVTVPANGTATINPNGKVTYRPVVNFFGNDSFSYTICDRGGLCSMATVTIMVTPVNDRPLALDDTAITAEDNSVRIDVAANDIDVDGNLVPASVMVLVGPADGTLSDRGPGTFNYSPRADFFGSERFTYQICDSDGLCDTAEVSIEVTPVNDRPKAMDDSGSTPEDIPLSLAGSDLLRNDTDVDGDILVVNLLTAPSHGTLQQEADASFTYVPDANFNGSDAFRYEACDPGGLCDPATFTIDVTPRNDPPVAQDAGYITVQDTILIVDDPLLGLLGQAFSALDVDGDTLSVDSSDTTSSFGGTVSVNPDGSFIYTPALAFTGFDTFSYTMSDGNGGFASATVTIEVTVKNGRGIAVSWGNWTLNQINLSGLFNVQNESGVGFNVQLLSYQILVEYRQSGSGSNVWSNINVTGCTFDAVMPTLLVDQMVINFDGCQLANQILAGSTVRVTAAVEIYGHKGQGDPTAIFLSRLSKEY